MKKKKTTKKQKGNSNSNSDTFKKLQDVSRWQENDRRVRIEAICFPLAILYPSHFFLGLTVSPSYNDEAYTSDYLYLISSKRCCRTIFDVRRALGSGLPSADRMATLHHSTISLPLKRFSLFNSFPLFLSLFALLGTIARPHTRNSRRR